MTDLLLVVIGIALGAVAGWVWASRRHDALAQQLSEVKGRGARAVQIMKEEVVARVEQKEAALTSLSDKLNEERQSAAAIREQYARVEPQIRQLTETATALRGDLAAATDQAFQEVGQLHEIEASLEHVVGSFTRAIAAIESRLLASNRQLKDAALALESEPAPAPTSEATVGIRPPSAVRPTPPSPARPIPPSQVHSTPVSQVNPTPVSQVHPTPASPDEPSPPSEAEPEFPVHPPPPQVRPVPPARKPPGRP